MESGVMTFGQCPVVKYIISLASNKLPVKIKIMKLILIHCEDLHRLNQLLATLTSDTTIVKQSK